jgi:hypothetical protein
MKKVGLIEGEKTFYQSIFINVLKIGSFKEKERIA